MKQTVRCKFKCDNVEDHDDESMVTLSAVVEGSEENERFFKWTPYGEMKFGWIDKKLAHERFKLGQEYYIEITESKN